MMSRGDAGECRGYGVCLGICSFEQFAFILLINENSRLRSICLYAGENIWITGHINRRNIYWGTSFSFLISKIYSMNTVGTVYVPC
jgi:hypothetical protein